MEDELSQFGVCAQCKVLGARAATRGVAVPRPCVQYATHVEKILDK